MIDNSKSFGSQLELKDWLVFVPLLSSALAITYEIGSFIPLGSLAFGLFSVSDHLLWALQALPLALALVVGVLIAEGLDAILRSRPISRTAEQRRQRARRRAAALAIGACCITIIAFIVRAALPLALAVILFCYALLWLGPNRLRRGRIPVLGAIAFSIILVLCIGYDVTKSTLNHTASAEFDFGGSNVKREVLVRSGDRGVLLYDPVRGTFLFNKWDGASENYLATPRHVAFVDNSASLNGIRTSPRWQPAPHAPAAPG
jgi:hypothetical protein